MDEFKSSIKKIRKVFIILTIIIIALAIVLGALTVGISIVLFSNIESGSESAAFEAIILSTSAIGVLILIPIILIITIIILGILWGIFGIIYAVKNSNYKKRQMTQMQVNNIEYLNKQ